MTGAAPHTGGRLRSVVTYLEITDSGWSAPPAGPLPEGLAIELAAGLSTAAYRTMYRAVGEAWLWWERLVLPDGALARILAEPGREIRILRRDGVFAGYSELDFRHRGQVEIAYFGLTPASIGRGLGRCLMTETLRAAWQAHPRRVWLHTCTEDHPGAIGFYERMGFRRYRNEAAWIDDPRLTGLLPRGAAPHVPLAAEVPRVSAGRADGATGGAPASDSRG